MSDFKLSKKKIHSDNRTTIINKHNEIMDNFESDKKKLPQYKRELKNLMKDSLKYSNNNQNDYSIIKKIEELKIKINNIETDTDMHEYLFRTMTFIKDNNEYDSDESECNNNLLKVVEVKNKSKMKYENYIAECVNNKSLIKTNNSYYCRECNHKLTIDVSNGINLCYNCGNTEINNKSNLQEWSNNENHDFTKPYAYKRTNHFKEWILQIQGKEGTTIPLTILDDVKAELIKHKIVDNRQINHDIVKNILKKLKYNKYYEHIPNIIYQITGNKQLKINEKLEGTLTEMFDKIQQPFQKHCPCNRKNFLSYSYTLYKFFQILNKNEYLSYFPLLKSREKLFEQEKIWKNICADVGWEFIPCI